MNSWQFINTLLILLFFNPVIIYADIICDFISHSEYLCSDEESFPGNEPLLVTCGHVDYFLITIQLNRTTDLRKSDFQRCKAYNVKIIQGSLKQIQPKAMEDFTYLEYLNLSRNGLKDFYLSSLPKPQYPSMILKTLDLSHNKIAEVINDVNPDALPEVSNLDLSYNKITNLSRISFPNPHELNYLSLSHNGIESIPFNTISKLFNLFELNLSGNKLHNLPFGVFNNLDLLSILDLSDNRLVSSDLHTVYGLKNLFSFYFDRNQIDHLDFKNLPASVKIVSFFDNKLNLSCQQLAKMILDLRDTVAVVNGPDLERENIHGIACDNRPGHHEESKIEISGYPLEDLSKLTISINPVQFSVLILILSGILILLIVNTCRSSIVNSWIRRKFGSTHQELLEM